MAVVSAAVLIGGGYFIYWLVVAAVAFMYVGRHEFGWKRENSKKSREYYDIQWINEPNWTREIRLDTAQKLELSAIVYDAFQMIFFILSAPSFVWTNPNNSYLEFSVYFLRALCLDLPVSAMIPLFALMLTFVITYIFLVFIHFFTSSFTSLFWRTINNMIDSVISRRGYGPEIMNFFFWSMFMAYTRYVFRFISCADSDPVNSSSWLINSYFGDFSCWKTSGLNDNIPLLLFFLVFNATFLLVAIQWSAKRIYVCPAFPSLPRYHVAIILSKFLLSLGLVVFFSVPEGLAVLASILFLFLFIISLRTLPYLPSNSSAMSINSFVISSYFTAFYTSLISAFIFGFEPRSSTSCTFLVGIIPVFGFSYWGCMRYLRKYKLGSFERKSRKYIRELLLCIVNDDMITTCCSYLTVNFCQNPLAEEKLVEEIQKLQPADQQSLFSPGEAKNPIIQWWNKWKVLHFDKETTLEMVTRKIKQAENVPRLTDLACRAIIRDEIDWAHSPLPLDLKQYFNELLRPDPSVFDDEPRLRAARAEGLDVIIM